MKHTETVTTTRTVITCDMCGDGGKIRRCIGCGRDICEGCGDFWYTDPWTQTDNGDYPNFVCNPCNEQSLDLVESARKVNSDYEQAITSLEGEWTQRCKTNQS